MVVQLSRSLRWRQTLVFVLVVSRDKLQLVVFLAGRSAGRYSKLGPPRVAVATCGPAPGSSFLPRDRVMLLALSWGANPLPTELNVTLIHRATHDDRTRSRLLDK